MALTWTLVATISREADQMVDQRLGGFVDGDKVCFYAVRNTLTELWRSNDRGVNWSFYDTTASAATNITGPAKFDSKWWIKSQVDNLLIHTPVADPGAGGFTTEATGAISPVHYPQPLGVANLYLIDNGAGGTNKLWRRTGAATFTGVAMPFGDVYVWLTEIPGTSDFLVVDVGSVATIHRITPGDPIVDVNSFAAADMTHQNAPISPVAALSSTDYWMSTAAAGNDPAKIYRTTDGGTNWSEKNPTNGFWEAFAGGGEQGHGSGFVRFGGKDYGFLTFKDAGVPDDDREHVKVMKWNGTTWDAESDDTNDGYRVVQTLVGLNANGDLDFYAVTCSVAANEVKVYRATVLAVAFTLAATAVGVAGLSKTLSVERTLNAVAVGVAGLAKTFIHNVVLAATAIGNALVSFMHLPFDEDRDGNVDFPDAPSGSGGFSGKWTPIGPIKKVEGVKLGGFTRSWLERHRRRHG